ncbi:MAG: tyrosine--tRNA ligase, partial [Lachnospiraceae bacterium]|nr:tyrosine--tRNA ligase [Lachnospiraceae bacterium]
YELTTLVHGEEEGKKALEAARALFTSGNAANMPTADITSDDLKDGAIDIISLLVKSGLVASRNEGRRGIEQGGVSVNDEKVTDIAKTFTAEDLQGELIIKRGKKNFRKINFVG